MELRFVDMFMAAIGALIFMAMLLSWVMRDLGAKEAAAKAGTPELQVLAYVTGEAGGELDTNLLGLLEVDVRVRMETGPQVTNEFSPRMPRPPEYFSEANFHPTNFLSAHDTNANTRFTYSGNALENALALKEVPFAWLTMPDPKPNAFTFEFFVRPIPPTDGSKVTHKADVQRILGSINSKCQLKFSAIYQYYGQAFPVETQGPPVLPQSWPNAPRDQPALTVQIGLPASGELKIISP